MCTTLLAVISYILGSIPFGIVLGKVFKTPDLRTIGSGNIGATNAFRTGNKFYGALTFLADGLKGGVAVFASTKLCDSQTAPYISLLFAVLGHIFSCFLKFKGGKGVATFIVGTIFIEPSIGLMGAALWGITFYKKRVSALASVYYCLFIPTVSLVLSCKYMLYTSCVLSAVVIYKHKENIKRLLQNKENDFKSTKS